MATPYFGFGITVFLLCICARVSGLTNLNDVNILNTLKSNWGNTAPQNWSGSDPCGSNWVGVTCTNSGQINSLINNPVQDTISHGLQGNLPSEIGQLTELQTLDLSYNTQLIGQLPQTLENLTNLQSLVLIGCNFSGNIPDGLGKLVNLTFLALNSNQFSGSIPPSLGNLVKVNWLDLSDNQLTGTLPVSDANQPGLDKLQAAQHFHFNKNKLAGPIPPSLFSANMSLIHVLFDSNDFTGEIPSTLGLVQSLEALRLDRNSLSGLIPSRISNLTNLYELILSNNKLNGSIPDLSGLTNLQYLDLSNNYFNSSEFPQWLPTVQDLTTVVLENCSLTGQIPPNFFNLAFLETANLSDNHLNGSVVLNSSVSPFLQLIDLQNNSINDAPQLGNANISILLRENPFCQSQSSGSSIFCKISSGQASYATSLAQCGGKTCSGGLKVNPRSCQCQQPYQGRLVFKAPSFSDLNNQTIFQGLQQSLQSSLTLAVDAVYLCCFYFDSNDYLNTPVQFFPIGNLQYFAYPEIMSISSFLGNQKYTSPSGFGPYLFLEDPYHYQNPKSNKMSTGAIAGIAVAGAVLALAIAVIAFYALKQKKRADQAIEIHRPFASWGTNAQDGGGAPKLKGARWFSFAEIKKVTNNFSDSNEIGKGGYGMVYKAMLDGGEMAAIKRAKQRSMQGGSEFKNEVELLSRVHHKNLVGLIGFCFEQEEQMLVYEYIPNGTLGESLSGKTGIRLDWGRRVLIALGSARGLTYLHELADPPIIHRDIKPANILLDMNLTPKVADFGLSKLISDAGTEAGGNSYVSTDGGAEAGSKSHVKGTLGYLDPEYYTTQQLSEKSDVYSFGIVLLELVTARPPIQGGKFIVRLVKEALESGGISGLQEEIMDPLLRKTADTDSLTGFERFLSLALSCVEESGAQRPSMREVVKELELIVEMGSAAASIPPQRDNFVKTVRFYNEDLEARNSSGDVARKEGFSDMFEYSGAHTMSRTVQPM